MAKVSSGTSFVASGSNAAGATTTGSLVDLSGKYGTRVFMKITNGATGPTLPCEAFVDVSNNVGTPDWFEVGRYMAGVLLNGVYVFEHVLGWEVVAARVRFVGNTVQAVTVEADGHTVDSL